MEANDFSFPPQMDEEFINRSIERMSLIDDIFFRTVLRDNPKGAEAIVRVALDMPEVRIDAVTVQNDIAVPGRKGVRLDLKARKPDGTLFDIEMQKEDEGNLARRSRYYLSALTVDSLKSGQGYEEIPDTYVLFVCKKDPFGKGRAVYTFLRNERAGEGSGLHLQDGSQISFFNCSYQGKDAYGKLARDLTSPDYTEIIDPVLKDAVKSGKIGKRRNELVTGISKQIWDHAKAIGVEEGKAIGVEEGKAIGIEEGKAIGVEEGKAIGVEEGQAKARAAAVLALLRDGRLTPEAISDILGLPLDYVLSLAGK